MQEMTVALECMIAQGIMKYNSIRILMLEMKIYLPGLDMM